MGLNETDIVKALGSGPAGQRSDYDLNGGQPRTEALPETPAAVLCGLVPRAAGLTVVLTRRARHLRRHAGQIAFPGGKVEPSDRSAVAAALRESEEEVGLGPHDVRVLGCLDVYRTVTGFRVTPVVGVVDPGWTPQLDPTEVDLLFEVPLDFLMDPANCARHSYQRGSERRHYYAMPWGEHYIWGATAGMLKALADRIADVRHRA
ncbi:MAG: CoA pyrophosphatase [Pikeienuella sp.]